MSIFILKFIALIAMIIDHIGYFFIKNNSVLIYREIGRIAAPIFLFVFVEGYFKTSNKKHYQKRLLIYSTIMFLGNLILNNIFIYMYPINTNIFFTMWLCFLFLSIMECKSLYIYVKIGILIFLCIPFYFAEYSFIALFSVIFYYIYLKELEIKENKRLIKFIFACSYSVFFLIYCLIINNIIQYFMILSLIPILCYNFKLGLKNKIIKYFYYSFYIGHLWLFVIILNFLKSYN